MSKIITNPVTIAQLNKVHTDLDSNQIVVQDGVVVFIHKADPENPYYSVIRIKRGDVITTSFDDKVGRLYDPYYTYHGDDDPLAVENSDMDPCECFHDGPSIEIMEGKYVQWEDDLPDSERLFSPDRDRDDDHKSVREHEYRSFEEMTKTTKQLVHFNSLTGFEEHTSIYPNGAEYAEEGDRPSYADLIDPPVIPEW